MGDELTRAVLDDYRSAPVEESFKALLAFIEKLTLQPGTLEPRDVDELIGLGLGRQAIIEAVQVCVLFNVIVRIADALDFDIPPEKAMSKAAGILLKRGYKL